MSSDKPLDGSVVFVPLFGHTPGSIGTFSLPQSWSSRAFPGSVRGPVIPLRLLGEVEARRRPVGDVATPESVPSRPVGGIDPVGDPTAPLRVFRGASFLDTEEKLRASTRTPAAP